MGAVDDLQNVQEYLGQEEDKIKEEIKAELQTPALKDTASLEVEYQHIPIGVINKSNNLRPNLPSIEELALSIKQQGLLQPLVVLVEGEQFKLICGARRLAALNLIYPPEKEVSCQIYSKLDEGQFYELMFTENEQRVDLPPLAKARAIRTIMKYNPETSLEDIGKLLGRSSSWAAKHLKLLDLPDNIQDKLEVGDMSFTVADLVRRRVEDKSISETEVEDLLEQKVEGEIDAHELKQTLKPSLKNLPKEAEENMLEESLADDLLAELDDKYPEKDSEESPSTNNSPEAELVYQSSDRDIDLSSESYSQVIGSTENDIPNQEKNDKDLGMSYLLGTWLTHHASEESLSSKGITHDSAYEYALQLDYSSSLKLLEELAQSSLNNDELPDEWTRAF